MAQPTESTIETPLNEDAEKELPTLKVKKEPVSEEQTKSLAVKSTPATTITSTHARTASHDARSRNGQTSIMSFFSKTKAAANDKDSTVDGEKKDEDEMNRIDLESIKGVFGWTTLEGVHVPYILRMEEKFTAVRIIEKSLLKKFLQALPPDVYSCTYIKSYFITDNEAKLLNEINMKHCDRQFGHEHFTVKDLVVQLTDVVHLYKFLSTCYTKLICSSTIREKENPCGIVKIGGSPIPYVCRDAVKYVPLSLFGQEVQSLETKGEKLEPWEVSYMKFCCRVANISNEFLQEHGSLVVSLDDVKQLASESVLFEDWWPSAHENRVNKVHRNGPGLMMACLTRNGDGNVGNNNQKEPSTANANVVLPCAVPASGYYDENLASRTHKEPVSGGSKLRTLQTSVSGKTQTADNATNRIQAPRPAPSFSSVPYPFSANALSQSACGLLPSTMTSHNPQPYIFNGQWWGPFVSRSAEGHCFSTSAISPYESWAAHCPQGATQCSPGGNSSELQHNPIAQYVQSIEQMMKSNQPYNWPLSLDSQQRFQPTRNSSESAFPAATRNVASKNSISHKTSVASEKTRHSNWSLDASNHSNGHWSNVLSKPPLDSTRSTRHISTNSNVISPTSKDATYSNGSITHGNPRSTESAHHASQRSLSNGGYERGLSLVQHLTRPDEVAGGQAASHRHVVAPGSSQSFASKMSSPKPANQVPTSVASENRERHSVASWRPHTPASEMGTTLLNHPDSRHASASRSKLQELLCSEESKTSSRTTGIDLPSKNVQSKTPLYKIHDVIVGGMRFHGINSVANAVGTAIMVPVKEVEKNLSPHVSAQLCEHILTQILQISLFECNRSQEEVLRKVMRYGVQEPQVRNQSPLKLIRVEDLTRHLPQVIYTLAKLQIQGQMEAVSEAKRARRELGVSI